jgi:hypothetical protein
MRLEEHRSRHLTDTQEGKGEKITIIIVVIIIIGCFLVLFLFFRLSK